MANELAVVAAIPHCLANLGCEPTNLSVLALHEADTSPDEPQPCRSRRVARPGYPHPASSATGTTTSPATRKVTPVHGSRLLRVSMACTAATASGLSWASGM
jgi:hypothetical protein